MKSWDDENLKVPEDIKNNLTDILKFEKPSKIQAYTIPMILGGENLIALAPTGCGKTGAYGVSSVMRVDRSIQKCQVICITHTRELCQQVFNVYQSICKGTGITLDNGLEKAANGQILVCHHGKLPALTGGRKPMDLSKLKVIVIDECDFFFADQKNYDVIKGFAKSKAVLNCNPQYLLFSATHGAGISAEAKAEEVKTRIAEIIDKA